MQLVNWLEVVASVVGLIAAMLCSYRHGKARGREKWRRFASETFDDVLMDETGAIVEIQVKEGATATAKELNEFLEAFQGISDLGKEGEFLELVEVDVPDKAAKRKPFRRDTRVWDLAGLLFDHKTRADVYEPVINEIREDFLIARKQCLTRGNHIWVKSCFAIRGSLAFIRCMRICLLRPALSLIPGKLKQFWKLFS
jgi:hypothetical protein